MAWSPEPYSESAFISSTDDGGIRNQLPSAQVRHSGITTIKRKHKKSKRHEANYLPSQSTIIENPNHKSMGSLPHVSGMTTSAQIIEELSWRDMDSLKELTCPMAKKKEIRNHLLKDKRAVVKTGFAAWRQQNSIRYKRFQEDTKEVLRQTQLWRSSIHEIEGRFGNGIRSYFAFLRWLFHLNVYIFLLVFCFICIPTLIYESNPPTASNATNCSASYQPYDSNQVYSFSQYVIWWFTGQGFMEETLLFYGYYNKAIGFNYNIGLAYVLVAISYFGLSLFLLVRRAGKGLKESLISDENKFYSYSNKVFGGWDFCITDSNAAELKHSSIKYELETDLEEERIRQRHANRTTKEKAFLYLKRFFINLLVLAVLGGSMYGIYAAANYSLTNSGIYKDTNFFLDLLVTYLTSIVITIANFIAPLLFEFFIEYEDYTPAFKIKFTLIRTVILRLTSVMFLYVVVYFQVHCKEFTFIDDDDYNEECQYCEKTQCWETYMGQEMYKLTILDFFIVVAVTLFVEFPRRLLFELLKTHPKWLIQEFYITGNILSLIYSQTLAWIGAFYAPLIPVIVIIKFFVFFYLKKLTLVYNCRPATRPYRASRSGTFFFIILLVGYIVAVIPVGVSIARLAPSKSCGLFQDQATMFGIVTSVIATFPSVLRDILWFLGSPGFAVIAGVILCLILYYYIALKAAHKKMISLLKEQLALEGKDKQFLLNRVNALQESMGSEFGTKPRLRARVGNNNGHVINIPEDDLRPETGHSSLPGQTD